MLKIVDFAQNISLRLLSDHLLMDTFSLFIVAFSNKRVTLLKHGNLQSLVPHIDAR